MDDPQIITSPSGEELVVVPRRDYEALVHALSEAEEELADIATLDARKSEMTNLALSVLPAAVSALLLQGHGRLKALIEWRGITVPDLAVRAHVSESDLIRLETEPGVADAVLRGRLAAALDVPADWLACDTR
jgi:hypothetical protein